MPEDSPGHEPWLELPRSVAERPGAPAFARWAAQPQPEKSRALRDAKGRCWARKVPPAAPSAQLATGLKPTLELKLVRARGPVPVR